MSSQILIKDLIKSFVPFAQLLQFFPLLIHGRMGPLLYLYESLLRGLLILTITPIIALIILYLWTLGHEVLMVMPASDMVTVGL